MYINSVIIPDEKVRIRIRGSQLLVRVLCKYLVIRIDEIIRQVAIEIGFTVEIATIVTRAIVAEISLCIF